MKDAVTWVKEALAMKEAILYLTHYLVKDGHIYAANGRMMAAHPFPSEDTFLVPGEAFERSLFNLPGDPTLKLEGPKLVLRGGKARSQIATIAVETWVLPTAPVSGWQDLPPEFCDVLGALRPFISDNATQAWATCLAISNGFAYATNNIVIARAPLTYTGPERLVPSWAVDFILNRKEGLASWAWDQNAIYFLWENGGWMRTQTMTGAFPTELAENMLKKLGTPEHEITPEWRTVFARISKLIAATGEIYLQKSLICGRTGEDLEAEEEAVNPTPSDSDWSVWDPRFLEPVIAAATHWNPTTWPQPAPFRGALVQGIVVGRRAK